MKLSVIMPVYNERAFLPRIVERVLKAPLPPGVTLELIAVDDGSRDGSAEVLADLAQKHPALRAFFQARNQGKGSAIARGIQEAGGDIILFQDADLEYDPAEYPKLLAPIMSGHADVVYGSRFLGSDERRVLNFHHALGNWALTLLSNLTTGFNLTDMETCYKVFRADILKTIPIRSRRFGIEPEITAKIAKRHCTVYEVPISYHGRSYADGKKITWKDGIDALGVILKYWLLDDCFSQRHGHYVLASMSGARRFSEWTVAAIAPFLGDRILEVGAGLGNISRQLPRSRRLTVSDRDEEYLRLLRLAFRHYENIEVARLDLESDADFAGRAAQFDTVLCLNVLEHIADDRAALRRMASALAPGGRLVVVVPQFSALFGPMDQKLGHHRRYHRKDLRQRLLEAGLDVEALKDFNSLGLLGWFFNMRLLKRQSMSRFQLKVFDTLVPLLRRVEPRLRLPGLSLLAVGRKPS